MGQAPMQLLDSGPPSPHEPLPKLKSSPAAAVFQDRRATNLECISEWSRAQACRPLNWDSTSSFAWCTYAYYNLW